MTPLSIGDIRDVFIIIYGVLGILFFAVAISVTVALFFVVRGLVKKATQLLDESVRPTLGSIRGTAETIRGTAEFVGEAAARPIARTYGIFAGVRKGIAVLSGLGRRERG
jgi:hypothetical protein